MRVRVHAVCMLNSVCVRICEHVCMCLSYERNWLKLRDKSGEGVTTNSMTVYCRTGVCRKRERLAETQRQECGRGVTTTIYCRTCV